MNTPKTMYLAVAALAIMLASCERREAAPAAGGAPAASMPGASAAPMPGTPASQ